MASTLSSALSNISICYPCNKTTPSMRAKRIVLPSVNAVAGGLRDSLDRLQLQQRQPNQRWFRVLPTEPLYRFPAAQPMEDPLDGYSRGRTPWAIKETEKDYKLRFDVPGMAKNDVKVWVEEKMLVFKAEKAQQEQATGDDGSGSNAEEQWPDKSSGKCGCRIALPENIAFEDIKAQVQDGVLYISIPKATNTPKTIGITVE